MGLYQRYLVPLVRIYAHYERLVLTTFKLSIIGSRTFKVAAAQKWKS